MKTRIDTHDAPYWPHFKREHAAPGGGRREGCGRNGTFPDGAGTSLTGIDDCLRDCDLGGLVCERCGGWSVSYGRHSFVHHIAYGYVPRSVSEYHDPTVVLPCQLRPWLPCRSAEEQYQSPPGPVLFKKPPSPQRRLAPLAVRPPPARRGG